MSENIETTKAFYDVFMRGDIEGFLGMMSPECTWVSAQGGPFPGVFEGPQVILEKLLMPLAQRAEFTPVNDSYSDAGDGVVFIRGTYQARRRDNGHMAECPYVSVIEVRDGAIHRVQDFYDTHVFRTLLQ